MDIGNEGLVENIKRVSSIAISARWIRVEALSSDKTALFFRRRITEIGLEVSLMLFDTNVEQMSS
jgi:hypothetical protein